MGDTLKDETRVEGSGCFLHEHHTCIPHSATRAAAQGAHRLKLCKPLAHSWTAQLNSASGGRQTGNMLAVGWRLLPTERRRTLKLKKGAPALPSAIWGCCSSAAVHGS